MTPTMSTTASAMDPYPPPTPGASLLLSFRMPTKTILILGGDTLAASRAFAALEADATVKILVHGGLATVCDELRWRAERGQLEVLDWAGLPVPESSLVGESDSDSLSDEERDIVALEKYISNERVSLVCITDTSSTLPQPSPTRLRATHIARLCRTYRIPINVTDMPDLCDFSFTATHRFVDPVTSSKSPLQVGVTTNGEGCRLAGRVRREIVAGISKDVGSAAIKVGRLRKMAKQLATEYTVPGGDTVDGEAGEDSGIMTPNRPVPIRSKTSGSAVSDESRPEAAKRHMRWVAQVSEYWPISRLAAMTEQEMKDVLDGEVGITSHKDSVLALSSDEKKSQHGLDISPPISKRAKGRIFLAGSGPGHPSLLTLATHNVLTKHADIVLSDKLVPAPVLDLIPPHVQVRIARKFPGNADGAQIEMMEAAIEAANRGLSVVRLKQGDPIVYARAGEELAYFRTHGYAPLILPGLSSALAAPACAGIPVTHRGVAESFVVCTGVGRMGKEVSLPGYDRARTVLVLMGVARLGEVVGALVDPACGESVSVSDGNVGSAERERGHGHGRRDGPAYPPYTPIAIIERGSMPDQRVLVSTLEDVEYALASVGEQRPPGMIVIGWAVLAFGRQGVGVGVGGVATGEGEGQCNGGAGDVGEGVLEDVEEEGREERDRERVRRWLGGRKWDAWEGLGDGWADL